MTVDTYHAVPAAAAPALPPANDTDGWIAVVADVARLAQQIANTDFVPDAMRGKPAAVTAAILAGREMGVGPMTSLQHIHVIKGKPGQSAHLMRGLVLAAGHEFEPIETTDTRAVVRGRRRGETDWTEVTFTADQARRAKIDLGGYPEDKLFARASARLCRRKFADVISGLAYTVEELQDGDAPLIEAGEAPAALPAAPEQQGAAPVRTAQRARKTTTKTSGAAGKVAPVEAAPAPAAAAPAPATAGPPLPGEDGYDEQGDEQAPGPAETDPATKPQNRLMHALFREAECAERDERLTLTGILLKRELDTSAGLTVKDAGVVIDALESLKAAGHPDGLAGAVAEVMNAHAHLLAEQELAEQEAADDTPQDQT